MRKLAIFYGLFVDLISLGGGTNGECFDLNGRSIAEDMHFVPGPDACTLCVCDGGLPKRCKSVLCAPPQDCQAFTRVGQQCCRFVCLDDQSELAHDNGLRLVVGAAAVLSLCLLLLLLLRLRQKKSAGRQRGRLNGSQPGLGSLGYITAGGLSYLPQPYFPGTPGMDRHIEFHYQEPPSNLALWKPSSEYFPRGEAPPPYEEAVARDQIATLPTSHRTIPLTLTAGTIRVVHPGGSPEVAALRALRARAYHRNSETLPLQYHISISGFCSSSLRRPQREAQVQVSAEESCNIEELPPTSTVIPNSEVNEISTVVDLPHNNDFQRSSMSLDKAEGGSSEATDTTSDNDDYRSECENCKSSPPTEYLMSNEEPEVPETMTLQRIPKEQEETFYRTSLTLPVNSKKPRSILSGSRESWFNAMPESSSEEEEEED